MTHTAFQGRNEDYKVAEFELVEEEWGSGFMAPMYAPPLPKEEMHKASGRKGDEWAEAGAGNHGPNTTWTYIHISPEAKFHNISFHTPIDHNRDRIFVIMYRNFMHDPKHDSDFDKSFWYVAEQDRVILEGMSPLMTPDHNRQELFVPSDKCVDRYRKYCNEWTERGWKIDTVKLTRRCRDDQLCDPQPGSAGKSQGLGITRNATSGREIKDRIKEGGDGWTLNDTIISGNREACPEMIFSGIYVRRITDSPDEVTSSQPKSMIFRTNHSGSPPMPQT